MPNVSLLGGLMGYRPGWDYDQGPMARQTCSGGERFQHSCGEGGGHIVKTHLFHRGGWLCWWLSRRGRDSSVTPPWSRVPACVLSHGIVMDDHGGQRASGFHALGHDEVSDHGLGKADHHGRGRGSKRNGLPG